MSVRRPVFSWCQELCILQRRCFAKLIREQDPEEVDKMPIFQYATENSKRSRRVYMWGNAMCGALGRSSFVKPVMHKSPLKSMWYPWRHPFSKLHKVRDVSCGYGFTVFAASTEENDYSLFGTGLNSHFQIGYQCAKKDVPLEIVSEPVPIALPLLDQKSRALKVACGRAHTFAITDKEGVFSLGCNGYGQCGAPPQDDKTDAFLRIHKVPDLGERIQEVVCGQDHTLLLGQSGKVYACGWGADGQTGLGHYDNQFVPALVRGDVEGERIVQLSCAADCVLALSDKGEVFGWGNSEYMQLASVTDKQQENVPRRLPLRGVEGRVVSVAAGGTMCGVVNDAGQVWVWGYGILGAGPRVGSSSTPLPLPAPLFGLNEFNTESKVEHIAAGISHFAAITNERHLYMWGRNRSECLGLGKHGDQFFPYKVSVPAEVLKVSCGVDHTAVLCRSFT